MKITNTKLNKLVSDSLLSYDYEDSALRTVSLYFYEKNGDLVDVCYNPQGEFDVSIWIGQDEAVLTENQLDDIYREMELAFNVRVADDREYFYNQSYESSPIDDSYYIQ
tara:strand:+ start:40 stop:366 length:327 start_codon:yes stop_codon:yes gene_type:complete